MKRLCSSVIALLSMISVIGTASAANTYSYPPNCTWPEEMYVFDKATDLESYQMLLHSDLISDEMKRILRGENFVVGQGVDVDVELLLMNKQQGLTPLWKGGGTNYTHQYITSVALSILAKDKNISQLKTYSNTILAASDKPDADETSEVFAGHFFNPYTAENYLGNVNNTAFTNFAQHYSSAISYYGSGSYSTAFDELGRALHYLQDASEPHHASNLVMGASNHTEFEQYANDNRTQYSTYTLPNSSYDYALNTDYRTMLANCAYYAYDYKEKCQNTGTYAETLSATLKQAQRNSAAVLWKFVNDAGIV